MVDRTRNDVSIMSYNVSMSGTLNPIHTLSIYLMQCYRCSMSRDHECTAVRMLQFWWRHCLRGRTVCSNCWRSTRWRISVIATDSRSFFGATATSNPTCQLLRLVLHSSNVHALARLTPSTPSAAVPKCCCSKGWSPYWSNPLFLIFDIRELWRSVLKSSAPERPNVKN